MTEHAPQTPDRQSVLVARDTITISLAVACLGQSLPFGAASGPTNSGLDDLNPLEWTLSILLFLMAVALVLNFFHPWRSWAWRVGLAEMIAGAIWVMVGTYELLVPNDSTTLWRLGHALPAFGWAILALTTWRWVNVGRTRRKR
jgi:hypothetical protein